MLSWKEDNVKGSAGMTDFATWLQDYGYDRIFRMWKYKRMFTPFEQQEAFSDQSVFDEGASVLIKIRETAELPDGDVWIGYSRVETEVSENIEYVKLSEICLEYHPSDADDTD